MDVNVNKKEEENLDSGHIKQCHSPGLSVIFNHPAFRHLDGNDFEHDQERLQTYQVFLDLSECKGWWNMRLDNLCQTRKLVISGHSAQTSDRDFVLPVTSCSQLSHGAIQDYINEINADHHCDSVLLALVDDNSSIIYYRATAALCPPDTPETVDAKQTKNRQRLEKHRQRILQIQKQDKVTHVGTDSEDKHNLQDIQDTR